MRSRRAALAALVVLAPLAALPLSAQETRWVEPAGIPVRDDRQLVVGDGRFVTASARDMDGGLLVEHLRMVFAKGTPPERAVRRLKRGDRLHVFGIPRLDFAEISRRVRESRTKPYPAHGDFAV
jgi:hypothetical protein